MLKERGIWLCWPIIMRDKNPVAGISHIGIKIGVFKNYCEKNLLNSYCISEMLTIFSKNTRQLQTNARNQVNRMLVIIARKQTHIGELLREKFVFQLVIRQRDQNILNSQRQILALQNNPIANMADARRLPVLTLIASVLARAKPYTGQEPPNDYL